MKRYVLALVCALPLLMAACDRKLDTWSGRDVAYIDSTVDSTTVSFVYMDTEVREYNVNLYLRYMGQVAQRPRQIAVRVAETNATEGVDFAPLEPSYVVEPDHTFAFFTLTLLRNESLKDQEKYIIVELVANEDFDLLYPSDRPTATSDELFSKVRYKISFSEMMLEPPKTWREYQFGKFSPEKFQVICDVMEIPRETFVQGTYMTPGRANFIASYMKAYFIEMEKAGTPVLEKDNTPMKMGDNI